MHAEQETQLGRPRKHKDEPSETVSARVPASVKRYLAEMGSSPHQAAYEVLMFEKDLTEALEEVRQDLLLSAALQGQEYSLDRAETLARLVKLGLAAEKKHRK